MITLSIVSLYLALFLADVAISSLHDRFGRNRTRAPYDWPYHWFGIVTWDEPPIWPSWTTCSRTSGGPGSSKSRGRRERESAVARRSGHQAPDAPANQL